MTTTQATGRDQQIKRLCWLLDTMIEHLGAAPPESALGGIEQYEDEAAKLIDTTGLADEAGIPAELRPVIQRKEGGHDKKGTEEFAKLVEEAGMKAEFPEEGFPTCVAFRYVTTDCHESTTWFNWHAASGLGLGPEPDPPRGYKRVKPPPGHPLAELVSSSGPPPLEPDERYIRGFVACLKGWRSRAQWEIGKAKRRSSPMLSLNQFGKALTMDYRKFKEKAEAEWDLKPENESKTKWSIDLNRLGDDGKEALIVQHAKFLADGGKK